MAKEQVYIVLSHKHSLKKGSRTEWELVEHVEFVNQLRNRHLSTSSAIGDYLKRTMQSGGRVGMDDYDKFEDYIRTKYAKELAELDSAYGAIQVVRKPITITDSFGNVREPTVFDRVD